MRCIVCNQPETHVTNSRAAKNNAIWRRRHCQNCQTTFTTYERADLSGTLRVRTADPKVTEAFSSAALLLSILQAVTYAGGVPESAYWLAETVTERLLTQPTQDEPIDSKQIARLAQDTLQNYDQLIGLAYTARHKKALR